MADDLQATGTMAPEPDPSSILKALSEGQGMPQSPLNTWAATMSGYGAGMQGKENPVIGQQLQAQEANRRSQMAMYSVLQGMQQSKQAQRSAQREILQALPDDDPQLYTYKVKGLLNLAKESGAPVPPQLGESLMSKTLKPDQMKEVVRLITAGVMPEDVTKLIPGASMDVVQSMVPLASNDRFLSAWGIPTAENLRRQRLENEGKDTELLLKNYGIAGNTPQSQFALQYAIKTYGKPFSELDRTEQKDVIQQASNMDPGKLTDVARNALIEFGPELGVTNPEMATAEQRQRAVTSYRAARQKEMLDRSAGLGQLSTMGKIYSNELSRVEQNRSRTTTLDNLIDRMDRLIDEGKDLGLTNNPKALNAITQELKFWTAGNKLSKDAQWYRAWDTMDAQFGTVAQSIEGVTGNRLAQTAMQRALGYHPKRTDPYQVQKRVLTELKTARDDAKKALDEDQARVLRQFSTAAGSLGVPFIMGQQGQQGRFEAELEPNQ